VQFKVPIAFNLPTFFFKKKGKESGNYYLQIQPEISRLGTFRLKVNGVS